MKSSVLAAIFSIVAAPVAAFDEAFKLVENAGVWDVDSGPIVYVMDPAGSDDLGDGTELQAIRNAFRAWSCVPGVKIPVKEGAGDGPREINLDDSKNTLFWDETGDNCGMSGGTLGITVAPVSGGIRRAADICFNGKDHAWGVGRDTDVQSIALHEIGHLLGLDHPCDDDADPESCLPVSEAVMFPSWSNLPDREPRSSDIAGAVALYPLGDDLSACTAPFAQGERCGCSDECVDGLLCIADPTGDLRCSTPCSSQNRDCGGNAVCVLDNDDATGLCIRIAEGDYPVGAICTRNNQCENDICGAIIALGSSVCLFQCDANSDCDGGTCFDGFCLAASAEQVCAVEDEGCACAVGTAVPPSSMALALGLLAVLRRRRRA